MITDEECRNRVPPIWGDQAPDYLMDSEGRREPKVLNSTNIVLEQR